MRKYRVTDAARSDLKDIVRYTIEKWGRRQSRSYVFDLTSRFIWLAANPHAGRKRDDISPGLRSFPQSQHVVYYFIGKTVIEIVGIKHASQDEHRRDFLTAKRL